MNKQLIRVLIASTGIAASTLFNVASGQVLGGSGGLGGSLGGTLNGVGGTLNGTGSFGGALDADPFANRTRGIVDRSSGLARDSGAKLRDRTRSATNAVENEAIGAKSDLEGSAAGVTSMVKEETPALTEAARASVDAAADASGNLGVDATSAELANGEALTAPETETAKDAPNESSTQGSLIPALSQGETSTVQSGGETKRSDPSASARASARGDSEAQAQL